MKPTKEDIDHLVDCAATVVQESERYGIRELKKRTWLIESLKYALEPFEVAEGTKEKVTP